MFGKSCTIEAKGVGYLRIHSVDKDKKDTEKHFDIRITLNSPVVPIMLTLGGCKDLYVVDIDKEGNVDALINDIDNINTDLVDDDLIKSDCVNDGCLNDLSPPSSASKYKDEADKTGQVSIDYTKTLKRNNSAHLLVSDTQILNKEPEREAEENLQSFQSDIEHKTYQSCDGNTTLVSFSPDLETLKILDLTEQVEKDRIDGNNEQTSAKTFNKDLDPIDCLNNTTVESDDKKIDLNDSRNYLCKLDENSKCHEIKAIKGQVKGLAMAPNDSGKVLVQINIRESYIALLDGIYLMDLCDHLYQNSVLDMEKYRSLFEMSFARVNDRNAKRMLLLYLSEREVHKENLLKSLNESAHYPLIPYFFPT